MATCEDGKNMKNKKFTKIILGLLITVFMTSPFIVSGAVDRLAELEAELKQDKASLNAKNIEFNDAKNQFDYINKQLAATESNINKLNGDIKLTEGNIQATEAKILKNKDTLKKLVQLLYEQQKTNTFELLASAGSITELINAEEYNRSVDDKINSTITENKQLKEGLVAQKQQLTNKKIELDKELQNQRAQQAAQKAIVDSRYNEKLILEREVYNTETEKRAEIKRRRDAAARNNESYSGGTGGYPYLSSCGGIDPWSFYKCQCTSYAAWKWNSAYGKSWNNTRPGSGSGYNWANLGLDQGYSVSYTPQVGSIMVWSKSQASNKWGHVAIVEKINEKNGTVDVSEFNWVYSEGYSYRQNVSSAGHQFVY
jgi:surface antigen